ncbi:hypothetical protein KFL_001970050 [Klebsormidium nitens]|uniref:Uncharacterized protein n=1 Tax=Klebsormidium nitens TaxID=105231 RepID=A0A1Y1I123_KLENI|nr:hypothetical protein KFL_001970050 [Klebsormidium nitens]|eukprot:GAQ84604.1 hypothetical protein KFL_001970050 [Klebsormidium nitens]
MTSDMQRKKERTPLPRYWSLVLVTCCWTVLSAPNGSSAQTLPTNQSLPEPTLVNGFLLSNHSNWTNPVLGNTPRPLQVIKCQSLTKPVYDFYQIEAPRKTCHIPPPLVNVLHPKHTPIVLRILLGTAILLSVVLFGLILFWMAWVAFLIALSGGLATLAVVGCLLICLLRCIFCCCFPWEKSASSQEAPDVEAPGPSPNHADNVTGKKEVTKSVQVESLKSEIGWVKSNDTAKQERTISWEPANEFNPFDLSYTSEIQTPNKDARAAAFQGHVAASKAAADITPQSVELSDGQFGSDLQVPPVICYKTKERKEGPEARPILSGTPDRDVHRNAAGLNQYLATKTNGTSLTLQLCKNGNFQFYALAPDGCGRLEDPYGGRAPDNELPARIRATCPEFLGIWPAKVLVYWSPLNQAMAVAVWSLVLDCTLPLCECEGCKKERERRAEVAVQTEDPPREQFGVEETV